MLPHEAEAQAAIGEKYRAELDAMTRLHDTVISMMTIGSWTVQKTRGVNLSLARIRSPSSSWPYSSARPSAPHSVIETACFGWLSLAKS